MKKLLTALLVFVVLGTVLTGAAFAHGSQSKMGTINNQVHYNGNQRDYGPGYNRIELSEDQIGEIADLRDNFYDETEKLRNQLRDLNYELRNLEFRGASNTKVGEIEDQIEDLIVELDEKRLSHQQKIESVLTEEQLEVIEENRYNIENRFNGAYENNYNNSRHHNFNQRSRFSGRRDNYNGFNGHGYRQGFGMRGMRRGLHHGFGMRGMMGREFYRNNYPNAFDRHGSIGGFGPGWCH